MAKVNNHYTGCGCAGGDVITNTGEEVTEGRRKQKIYNDFLGRPVKEQVLNWDSSVYSTKISTYNTKDQIVNVKTYQGAETSDGSCPTGTCQLTTMDYDGHGRVWKHHTPEMDTNTFAIYEYYADDKIYISTDARRAKSTYTYNNRGLNTKIDYAAPTGNTTMPVPVSPEFTYDAAGNRLTMADESGTMSYEYNTLSQLTKETKTYSGLSNSYPINYAYNSTGQLQSVTDPWNGVVSYSYNKLGRLNSMTGSGFTDSSTGSVGTFISASEYRAWGAIKSITYGNQVQLSMEYNNRLLPASYEVGNLSGPNSTTISKGSEYSYYNDGQTSFVDSLSDNKFDRAYKYDHAARITQATTGNEANGGTTADGPYKQTFSYNVWTNTTSTTDRYWTESPVSTGFSFTN